MSKYRDSTYAVWKGMRLRCSNPNVQHYARYGGRGIRVCERWDAYENFLSDMGPRPEGFELDRIENDGNYEPANCRWVSVKENCRNRSSNRLLTYNGQTHCLAEWVEITGLPRHVLKDRIEAGWEMRLVFETPCRPVSHDLITIGGVSKSLSAWCRETGISRGTARYRLECGVAPEIAIRP